jgi:hypothetical protein
MCSSWDNVDKRIKIRTGQARTGLTGGGVHMRWGCSAFGNPDYEAMHAIQGRGAIKRRAACAKRSSWLAGPEHLAPSPRSCAAYTFFHRVRVGLNGFRGRPAGKNAGDAPAKKT